jgi:hypothetical protein
MMHFYCWMRIHFQEPNAQISDSAPPFEVCLVVRANQNVGGGFIVLFASRTLAVVPETANLLHSSNRKIGSCVSKPKSGTFPGSPQPPILLLNSQRDQSQLPSF